MNAPVKIHVRMADPVLIVMEVTLVVVERASLGPTVKNVHYLNIYSKRFGPTFTTI